MKYRHRPVKKHSFLTPFLLLITLFWLTINPATAQNQDTQAYWRYDAFGRIDKLVQADIDNDSMDDFLVVAEAFNVALVGADGGEVWTFRTENPVKEVTPLNIHGTEATSARSIVNDQP